METSATLKYARFSPRKARLIADLVRGLPIDQALNILTFNPRRASRVVKKVLESAIANAENNFGADIDELRVSEIYVDQGPTLKRVSPRAKGRADHILKRMCHITVKVSDYEKEGE